MQKETTRLPLRLPPKGGKTYSDLLRLACLKKQLGEAFGFLGFCFAEKGWVVRCKLRNRRREGSGIPQNIQNIYPFAVVPETLTYFKTQNLTRATLPSLAFLALKEKKTYFSVSFETC